MGCSSWAAQKAAHYRWTTLSKEKAIKTDLNIYYLFISDRGMKIREQAFISTTSRVAINNPNQCELLCSVHWVNFSTNKWVEGSGIIDYIIPNLLHYERSSTISIAGPDGVVGVAIRAEHLRWQQLWHQYTCDILGKIFILEVADSMGSRYIHTKVRKY